MKSEDWRGATTEANFNFSWAVFYSFWKWYFVSSLSSATFFFLIWNLIGLISNVSDKFVTPQKLFFMGFFGVFKVWLLVKSWLPHD